MGKAAKKVAAQYYIPHLAHATMEPPCATARIADGKVECWTSVQSPQAAHDLLVKVPGLEPQNVTVNVTLLGGGFGRKSKPDFAVEAGLVSKAMAASLSSSCGRARTTSKMTNWADRMPSIARALGALKVRNAVIDGEAIVAGRRRSDFFTSMPRLRRKSAPRAVLVAFDIVHLDGEDLRGRELEDRRAVLADVVRKRAPLAAILRSRRR